jgi:hypothetical protein
MKTTSVLAAAALVGSTTAKVHKLKLDKVPLSEQFVCHRQLFALICFYDLELTMT